MGGSNLKLAATIKEIDKQGLGNYTPDSSDLQEPQNFVYLMNLCRDLEYYTLHFAVSRTELFLNGQQDCHLLCAALVS